jgi:hypothetical protein
MNLIVVHIWSKKTVVSASGGQHVTDQPSNKTYHPAHAPPQPKTRPQYYSLTRTKFDDAVTRVTFVFEKENKQTRLLLFMLTKFYPNIRIN